MEHPNRRNSAFRLPLWLPVSLRTRLIVANILITAVSIFGLGYYVYYRGQQANSFLTSQLDESIRQKAVDTLTTAGNNEANTLNEVFIGIRKDLTAVALDTNLLLVHENEVTNGGYWNAAKSVARLQSGSWDNSSTTDPASVFMPARTALTPPLVTELNALKQLDFVAPTLLQSNADALAVYFGGTSGETLYYPNIDLANLVPPDFDVTQRPWYQAATPANNPSRAAVWSVPYLDAPSHTLVITSSFPIYDGAHGFRGVVAMDVQLRRISYLVSAIRLGSTGYAFVIDRDGRLIAMPDTGYSDLGYTAETMPLGQTFDQDKLPQAIPADLSSTISRMKEGKSGLQTITVRGQERYVIFRPIGAVGYSLAIIVPTEEMLAGSAAAKQQISMSATNTQQISFVLVAMMLGFALLATLWIGNTLIAPLLALTATAEQISGGDLDARAKVQGRDETAKLARALNTMTSRLRDLIQSLERRVKDRTAALETASAVASRRAAQFEAITEVTRAISSIRNMDELMPLVAAVISQYFDYYHVGIFLNDESNQFAWLIAANSDGGRKMLQRRHSLKIGEQGIVGYVAARGESRVARNVGDDAAFFNNPDLPDTKSEAALPLRRGPQVAGVLDVQSTRVDAFTDEDLSILAILADQVSLAMENTRLFETTRRSLLEAETLYRQYIQEAWGRIPQSDEVSGYRYTPRGAVPVASSGVVATIGTVTPSNGGAPNPPLIVPIKLRGQVIGNLVVQARKSGSWTQDQIELVQAVAERVALSAENARLFEETSRRAERERLVTEITSRIRSTNDPEEMIRTALDELRNALGAADIQVIPQLVSAAGQIQSDGVATPVPEPSRGPQRGNGAKK